MSVAMLTDSVRAPGDPRIERTGPSSLTAADNLARALGWFSLALGVVELVAPGRVAQAVGLDGKKGLVRTYGARELAAGVQTLSIDKDVGLASRILGDLVDIATLIPALGARNPDRGKALLALGAVAAITVLDCAAYNGVVKNHRRNPADVRDYSDRSGFPRGTAASRGLARQSVLSEQRKAA